MEFQTLFQSLMAQGSKIDNLWSMYIVVHLGVFWFFFLMHRPLLIVERIIAMLAYALFAFINGSALLSSYRLLEAMRLDIVQNFAGELAKSPLVLNALTQTTFEGRPNLILMTHGGALVFVALILAFRNSMITYYFRSYPPTQTGAGQIALD
jgi:hypothetical protein